VQVRVLLSPPKKMIEHLIYIILIVLISLTFVTAAFLSFAFRSRQDNHPDLKYFTASDFPGLEDDPVEFYSKHKVKLRGSFYYYDRGQKYQQIIVFPHGIGAGHHAYMHLIEAFCQQGFLVFSYDNTGCTLSEGKGIVGIPQAIIDLKYALKYLESTTYKQYPISVIGHSWGGYAAIRSGLFSNKIHRIIALAPLNNPSQLLGTFSPIFKVLRPFVTFIHLLKFGFIGTLTTQQILKTTKVPTLVISGDHDESVQIKSNFNHYQAVSHKNKYVQAYLAIGHRHNPYLSFEAEAYVLDEILLKTKQLKNETDRAKKHDFFAHINYTLVGKHDETIMDLMVKFIR
jgi:alpha-beta hydrolase superfamily lysophospholipase